jgi:hypothetical protein
MDVFETMHAAGIGRLLVVGSPGSVGRVGPAADKRRVGHARRFAPQILQSTDATCGGVQKARTAS